MNHAVSNVSPAATARLNRPVKAGATWRHKLIATLVLWQNRTNQRRHLQDIDDRLLADMGITRAEAEHESRKPFWQA